MTVNPKKVKLRSYQLRRPIVGRGILFVLQTKGCRDLVPCLFLNKNNELEKSYMNKNWIVDRTTPSLPNSIEEESIYTEMLMYVDAEG